MQHICIGETGMLHLKVKVTARPAEFVRRVATLTFWADAPRRRSVALQRIRLSISMLSLTQTVISASHLFLASFTNHLGAKLILQRSLDLKATASTHQIVV